MKLAIASDHAGYKLKEELKKYLEDGGHAVSDYGTDSDTSVDYPDYAHKAAAAIEEGKAECGILVCGSGIGMCIAANRHKGVRAVVLHNLLDAEMSRLHNDSNVACFGARTIDATKAKTMLEKWLSTPFEGARHQRRVNKIDG